MICLNKQMQGPKHNQQKHRITGQQLQTRQRKAEPGRRPHQERWGHQLPQGARAARKSPRYLSPLKEGHQEQRPVPDPGELLINKE